MYIGKLVLTLAMDHLPMHTLQRCVQRYDGNRHIKSFTCQDQYRCMGFAQLTYRESLRDLEACLNAQSNKLYHMGIRSKVARCTLAETNEKRDWRIYADFTQLLDTDCTSPLFRRESWARIRQHRLRTRCCYDRPKT